MERQETLGLGNNNAAQDNEVLSPQLAEFIDRRGNLNKDVIVVDNKERVDQGPDELVQDEIAPNLVAQQIDPSNQAPRPLPIADDLIMEDPEPSQPADTTMGGTEATLGDEDLFIGRYDFMIDVRELYSDNQETDH